MDDKNKLENSAACGLSTAPCYIGDFMVDLNETCNVLAKQLNESNERNGKLKGGLKQLKFEWEAQAKFLDNQHDHAEDRAAGRTYKECADILEGRFGI